MTEERSHNPLILVLDAILLLACAIGIYQVAEKAGIPVTLEEQGGRVCVGSISDPTYEKSIQAGDTLIAMDGHTLRYVEDVEFALDARRTGDQVICMIARSGRTQTAVLSLTRYYSNFYVVSVVLISLLFFGVGFVVYLKRPGDEAALVFHGGSVATGLMLSTTWGCFSIEPSGLGPAIRFLFCLAYTLTPALFFHFTALFPRRTWKRSGMLFIVLYAIAGAVGVMTGFTFVAAAARDSVDLFHTYLWWFVASRFFLLAFVIAGLVNIAHSYRTSRDESERRKLRWVLWGLFVGFTPFIVLWVIPQMILSYSLVPEEVMLLASGIIPVAFGISIVKYRIMDIDLIVNRSVVYGSVMTFLLLLYAAIVGILAVVVTGMTMQISIAVSGVAAIVVALLFEPLRRTVQSFVDRRFFRVRYDFRRAERTFSEQIKHCIDVRQLASLMVKEADAVIPVERIGFFILEQPGARLRTLAHKNFDMIERHGIRFAAEGLKTKLELPVAIDDRLEAGIPHESADQQVFERWGMAVVIPMLSNVLEILGFLVLGEKKSGARFSSEDIDLLSNVTAQAGLEIQRITLQQQLIVKQAEAEQLKVLSEMKSDFVSYVSHELRTPLTSIKMFAELLKTRASTLDQRSREYLGIIEGESDRLDRMVTTILDSARIEQGVKEYQLRDVDFREITARVLDTMKYPFKKQRFRVVARLGRGRIPIHADPDAVAEALLNIVGNAIKYSAEKKRLKVGLQRSGTWARCTVQDWGRGISAEALPHLFEKFYRDPTVSHHVEGVGLGLPLVKHIMDAHGGVIAVRSSPGKGSTFSLAFPLAPTNHGKKKNTRRRG